MLALQPGEEIAQILDIANYEAAQYLVLATKKGMVKKTALTQYDTNRSGGIIAINLKEEDELVAARLVDEGDDVLLVTKAGMSLRFSATDQALRPMGRSTAGVIGMHFRGEDHLLSASVINDEGFVFVVTEGGYAKEMPPEYFEKQKQKVREHLPKQDIIVTTALIPGRPAPKLITKDMVESMKNGSVIVDMAAEAGGNCELTKPGEVTTTKNGVIIDGRVNLPSMLAETASALFAKNLFNFVSPHFDKEKGTFVFKDDDATVEGTLVCKDGKIANERVSEALSNAGGSKKAPAKKADAKSETKDSKKGA